MDFYELLDHVVALLHQRGCVSYRALKVDRQGRLIGKRQGPQDWITPSAKALMKCLLAEER